MPTHIFPKSKRLKSRKMLQQVFAEGKSVRNKDIRLVYLVEKNGVADFKCGVGLSTKNFKHAVDRNRIKRLLREAYRLQQHELKAYVETCTFNLSIFILYTGKELPHYQQVYENVGIALQKLLTTLHAVASENN